MLSLNYKIAIVGAGNVATTFARALNPHADVVQIFSRNLSRATELAKEMNNPDCCGIDNLALLRADCDFYIISVADDAIPTVISQMPDDLKGVVVHTSGSVNIDVMKDRFKHYGSLYPLQTLSKNINIDPSQITLLTEGSDADTLQIIDTVALAINPAEPVHTDSQRRATAHLAAVFACNFANYLWGCAADILRPSSLSLNIFNPLILATFNKAMSAPDGDPHKVQTGPAMRGDLEVISRHIDALPQPLSDLYRTLSQAIINKHQEKRK